MTRHFDDELAKFKETLLTMGSYAESSVSQAVQAVTERNDKLAEQVQHNDDIMDHYEMDIDDMAINLLAKAPLATDLRLITVAMKISQNLERIGDEATTIARRALELNTEPQLKSYIDIPRMAATALAMLKESLDAFVNKAARKGPRRRPARQGGGRPQPPALPRTVQFHGGKPLHHQPLLEPDDRFQEPGTRRRPRHQHRRGSRLSLRGARHPPRSQQALP